VSRKKEVTRGGANQHGKSVTRHLEEGEGKKGGEQVKRLGVSRGGEKASFGMGRKNKKRPTRSFGTYVSRKKVVKIPGSPKKTKVGKKSSLNKQPEGKGRQKIPA